MKLNLDKIIKDNLLIKLEEKEIIIFNLFSKLFKKFVLKNI